MGKEDIGNTGEIHGNYNILCKLKIIQYIITYVSGKHWGMGSIPMANSEDWPENESSVDGSVGVDYHHGKSTLDDSRMEGAIRSVFGVSIFPTI